MTGYEAHGGLLEVVDDQAGDSRLETIVAISPRLITFANRSFPFACCRLRDDRIACRSRSPTFGERIAVMRADRNDRRALARCVYGLHVDLIDRSLPLIIDWFNARNPLISWFFSVHSSASCCPRRAGETALPSAPTASSWPPVRGTACSVSGMCQKAISSASSGPKSAQSMALPFRPDGERSAVAGWHNGAQVWRA